MKKYRDTHLFALYWPEIDQLQKDSEYAINDTEIVRRVAHVLRLKRGDDLLLFDAVQHALVTIKAITKRSIEVTVSICAKQLPRFPEITMLLPLLKRDALGSALYHLGEAGVNRIQLISTEKSAQRWNGEKDLDRCKRIIIAAAEQCKNFSFPEVYSPLPLEQALVENKAAASYYGYIDGASITKTLCGTTKKQSILLAIGPEADFSLDEHKLLARYEIEPLQLGPTILRAETAAFFLAASFRSVFN